MKLDKFQQFVKDGEYQADLNTSLSRCFIRSLEAQHCTSGEFEELLSNIEGSLDMSEFVRWSFEGRISNSYHETGKYTVIHVNKLIQTTLEEIEDIEIYKKLSQEPEDCTDIDKRAKELDQ